MSSKTEENSVGKRRKIGFIGTGVMGQSMAGHLLKAGHDVYIFSRTKSKAEGLLGQGGVWCATPKEVAASCDLIMTMVGYPSDVREVYLGNDGLFSAAKPKSVFIDFTTSQPSLAIEIAAKARASDCVAIDAPVSGGDVGARNATLSIMIGGDEATCRELEDIWSILGKTYVWQGGPGSGQHTKMVNQTLIATKMIGVCEGLLYAYKSGLDPLKVLQSVSTGAAGSWSLDNLAPRIIKGDFETGFYVEHFIKDMGIALEEAAKMELCLPGLALAHQLYIGLKAQGLGRKGTQALIEALRRLSGQAS